MRKVKGYSFWKHDTFGRHIFFNFSCSLFYFASGMYRKENVAMNTLPISKGPNTISQNMSDYDNDDDVPKSGAKTIVEDFVDNASTHGIPRVLNSSRSSISRVFWCLVTVGLMAALLYQGSKLVISFIGRPTTTKISLVTKSKLEFPSVTICNLNMMRRSQLNGRLFNLSSIKCSPF